MQYAVITGGEFLHTDFAEVTSRAQDFLKGVCVHVLVCLSFMNM